MPRLSRGVSLFALVALSASPAANLSAAALMRVGQWEVTSTSNGRARTFRNCVGTAEAGAMNGDARASRAYLEKLIPSQCKFTDYKVDGNSVSSTMTCGTTTVRSITKYHGDSYESESTTKTGSASEVASHLKARRVGDCPTP